MRTVYNEVVCEGVEITSTLTEVILRSGKADCIFWIYASSSKLASCASMSVREQCMYVNVMGWVLVIKHDVCWFWFIPVSITQSHNAESLTKPSTWLILLDNFVWIRVILYMYIWLPKNMPATCAITGKTYRVVRKRSKSMRSKLTKVKPNLVRVKIGNRRIKISARALRTIKKKGEMSVVLWPDNSSICSNIYTYATCWGVYLLSIYLTFTLDWIPLDSLIVIRKSFID